MSTNFPNKNRGDYTRKEVSGKEIAQKLHYDGVYCFPKLNSYVIHRKALNPEPELGIFDTITQVKEKVVGRSGVGHESIAPEFLPKPCCLAVRKESMRD